MSTTPFEIIDESLGEAKQELNELFRELFLNDMVQEIQTLKKSQQELQGNMEKKISGLRTQLSDVYKNLKINVENDIPGQIDELNIPHLISLVILTESNLKIKMDEIEQRNVEVLKKRYQEVLKIIEISMNAAAATTKASIDSSSNILNGVINKTGELQVTRDLKQTNELVKIIKKSQDEIIQHFNTKLQGIERKQRRTNWIIGGIITILSIGVAVSFYLV
jgi:hypothetical protein